MDKNNSYVRSRLADCFLKLKDFDGALKEAQLAVELDDELSEANVALGRVLFEIGRKELHCNKKIK